MKALLKDLLLKAGVYYQINEIRFRRNQRDISQKAFYATIIGNDDLIFDVGANVGQRSAIFSQLAGRVVAFEPQPECITHLRSRFELSVLNGLSWPVHMLSFEFTPLTITEAKKCIERVHDISANYLYNYCLGEELDFVLPDHVDYKTFSQNVLPELECARSFGDIYAVMRTNQTDPRGQRAAGNRQ